MSARTKAKRRASRAHWIAEFSPWEMLRRSSFGRAIRRGLIEQHGDAPYSLNEDGIVAEMTCPAFPVQIQGTVDGWPFYLRIRGGGSVAIARPGRDPVAIGYCRGDTPPEPGEYLDEDGIVSGEGCEPHAEVWQMLREAVAHWRATRGAGWPEVCE